MTKYQNNFRTSKTFDLLLSGIKRPPESQAKS